MKILRYIFLYALTCCAFFAPQALAATYGDFTYTVSNNEVTITGYSGVARSVTIPSQIGVCPVTSIGAGAFYERTGLTSVEIPDSVTSINRYAFYGCSGLTSVEIPNSVTSIGYSAFSGCSGLTSIIIPNSVTSIGSGAFSGCSGLTSVEIPNSVTSISDSAFYGCRGLTSVEIPNSVTSIGSYAFDGCSGLTSVEIPNSVTSIGDSAFSRCTGLTSITIPNSVTSIGYYAFSECTSLPVFDGLRYESNSKKVLIAADKQIGSHVSIPSTVQFILAYAFSECTGLTSVEIPNSVTSIGSSAFRGRTRLTSVEIPNSVTSIGDSAFYECTGLTSVEISNSVTSIGSYAFYGCTRLTFVQIPESVTSISTSSFDQAVPLLFKGSKPTIIESGISPSWPWLYLPEYAESWAGVSFALPMTTTSDKIVVPSQVVMPSYRATIMRIPVATLTVERKWSVEVIAGDLSWISLYQPAENGEFNYISTLPFSYDGSQAMCLGLVLGENRSTKPRTAKLRFTCGGDVAEALVVQEGVKNFRHIITKEPTADPQANGEVTLNLNNTTLAGEVEIPETLTIDGKVYDVTAIAAGNSLNQVPAEITYLVLPKTVKTIGAGAFARWSQLVRVEINADAPTLGQSAFSGCPNLKAVVFAGNVATADLTLFEASPDVVVYYHEGMSGWGSEFKGRPTVMLPSANESISTSWSAKNIDSGGAILPLSLSATYDFTYWSATSDVAWLSVLDANNAKVVFGLGAKELKIAVGDNPSCSARTGEITLTCGGKNTVITVTQSGKQQILSLRQSECALEIDGGYFWVIVTANVKWSATSDSEWLMVLTASGNGDGDAGLQLFATENTASASRTGIVRITAETLTTCGNLTKEIVVTQAGTGVTEVTPPNVPPEVPGWGRGSTGSLIPFSEIGILRLDASGTPVSESISTLGLNVSALPFCLDPDWLWCDIAGGELWAEALPNTSGARRESFILIPKLTGEIWMIFVIQEG